MRFHRRCVLLEVEFPTCRSCGVKNTPNEQSKLIENRGFECIERAHTDRHYVLSGPTFGSGGSNNVDSERSISTAVQVMRFFQSYQVKLISTESLILAQDERWRRA